MRLFATTIPIFKMPAMLVPSITPYFAFFRIKVVCQDVCQSASDAHLHYAGQTKEAAECTRKP